MSETSTFSLSEAHLASLAGELLREGFRVSTQECVSAQELLLRLAAAGELPRTRDGLATLLGPIFCSNPEQQSRFPTVFSSWWKNEFPLTIPIDDTLVDCRLARKHVHGPLKKQGLRIALWSCAVLAVLASVLLVWSQWRPLRLPVQVVLDGGADAAGALVDTGNAQFHTGTNGEAVIHFQARDLPLDVRFVKTGFVTETRTILQPLPTSLLVELKREVPLPGPVSTNLPVARVERSGGAKVASIRLERIIRHPRVFSPSATTIAISCVPPVLMGLFMGTMWWLRRRRVAVLERLQAETPPAVKEVRVAGGLHDLAPGLGVLELARDLRRRRVVPSRQLDVPATLNATLRHGGLLTPVFGSRAEPEYLLLIDRSCRQDHQAALADLFAAPLEAADVVVHRWYFDREPRRCWPANDAGRPERVDVLDLDTLRARYPEHRVLFFAGATRFRDPYTGKPQTWLNALRAWRELSVVTFENPTHWGAREQDMARLGLRVVPATRAGLDILSSVMTGNTSTPRFEGERAAHRRDLMQDSSQWLQREPPPAEKVERLCTSIRDHLGKDGFSWFAACAIYPEVHLGLTLRLGNALLPLGGQLGELLPRLARLIWMRRAFIPDWLRAALLKELPAPVAAKARETLSTLLDEAASGREAGSFALEVAMPREPRTGLSGLWERTRGWASRVLSGELFRQAARESESSSPIRDYVFLRFMAGRKISPLGVAAPNAFARLLYPGGVREMGMRRTVLVGASLLCSIGFLLFEALFLPGLSVAVFSPDGLRVVTAGADDSARIWDVATGRLIGGPLKYTVTTRDGTYCLDGSRIATASLDGTVRLWDAATGRPVAEPMKHAGRIWSAVFSSDGSRIVVVSWDHTARVWDTATGKPIGQPMKGGSVKFARFSPDGSRIATVSWKGTVRLWDATTGQPIGQLMKLGDYVGIATFSPNSSRVFIAGQRDSLLVDATTGQPIGRQMEHDGNVMSAAFSPDGSDIVIATSDGMARLWDAITGQSIGQPIAHGASVRFALFSPDGSHIVTAGYGGTARIWDAATGQSVGQPMTHGSSVQSALFSPDGSHIATSSWGGTARLWDAVTGRPVGQPMRHGAQVRSVAFSPDGSHIVTTGGFGDGTARIWALTFVPGLKVLLVGCDYPGSSSVLRNSVRDVRALAAVLQENYGASTVALINPTRSMFETELSLWASSLAADDTALLVLSGHGSEGGEKAGDDGDGFAFHIEMPGPDGSSGFAFRQRDLSKTLAATECGSVLVVADAVGAWQLVRPSPAVGVGPVGKPVRTALASSSRGQYAHDGGVHSPFAQALLRELVNVTDVVSGADLARKVDWRMVGAKAMAVTQSPSYGLLQVPGAGDGDFLFPAPIAQDPLYIQVREAIAKRLGLELFMVTRSKVLSDTLGRDALSRDEVLMALEDAFIITFEDSDTESLNTIGDIIDHFHRLGITELEEKPPPSAPRPMPPTGIRVTPI